MDLVDDIRAQLLETISSLETDLGELRRAVDPGPTGTPSEISEDLEERVKANAASLIAATGALRAVDEVLDELDDEDE